jgi:hypothetical protein
MLLDLLAFKVGWTACVVGAAAGMPLLGVIVVAFTASIRVAMRPRPAAEAGLYLLAAGLGYSIDSGLVLAGSMSFPEAARLGGPSPLWMVALWVNLAATLHGCMGWMRGRYGVAVVFGAIGGVVAYAGGARLGALVLGPTGPSLVAIGVAWALAMPALLWIADRLLATPGASTARALPVAEGAGP